MKGVIFDMFGTLTNGQANPEARIVQHFELDPSEAFYEQVEQAVCATPYTTTAQYLDALVTTLALPDTAETRRTILDIFRTDLEKEHFRREVPELLESLAATHRLGLISDLPHPDYYLVGQHGLDRFFHPGAISLSYRTGRLKPDNEEAFRTVADALGCAYEEILMVGDSVKSDLAIPRRLGMKTVLVRNPNRSAQNYDPAVTEPTEIIPYLK